MLRQQAHVNWTLNETGQELALLYRLNNYIGWFVQSPRKIKDAEKFWADVWKAWWGGCFWEREIWGDDDIEDLLSCLRRIMALKYRGLVQRYSTDRRVARGVSSKREPMNIDSEYVVAREVRREDATICEWIGAPSGNNNCHILGYLATSRCGIEIFAVEESEAVSITVAYAKRGSNGNIPL